MANCVLDKTHDVVIFPLRNCRWTRCSSWASWLKVYALWQTCLLGFSISSWSHQHWWPTSLTFFFRHFLSLYCLYTLWVTYSKDRENFLTVSISISVSSWSSAIFIKHVVHWTWLVKCYYRNARLKFVQSCIIPAFVKHFNRFYVHRMQVEYIQAK